MDQLLSKFKETEIKYKALKEQLNRGEISAEKAKEEIKRLMIPDDTGVYWMMGGKSGKWYKHVDGQWKEADPYQQFAPPEPEPEPVPEPAPPQPEPAQSEPVFQQEQQADALELDSHQQESVPTQENQFNLQDVQQEQQGGLDLGGFQQDAQQEEQEGLDLGTYQQDAQQEQEDIFTAQQHQQDAGGLVDEVESNAYSFDEIGVDSSQDDSAIPQTETGEGEGQMQVETAGGFLDTHADLNTVDTNEFVIKGDQQQFAEKSGDIGINIDLDREMTTGDVGGIDEEFAAQQTQQTEEEEEENPFIGQDSGEFTLDNVDQDTREKETDALQTDLGETMKAPSFGATTTLDQESQYGQETFASGETVMEDSSFADQLDQEETALQDSADLSTSFSLEDAQSIEEPAIAQEPAEDQALFQQQEPVAAVSSAAGMPAVDFSKYTDCVACKSKIQPIAVYCPFCGANQKEFNPKKKKSKKKIDTGTENELVIKSIKVLSFLFFLGGLGIIFGVIFGAIFGVLSDTMQQLHVQLPMMFQEVRGGFVGGLIFAAIGGIAGFIAFAFISLIISGIYNLISFVFGGIRLKVKG